MQNQGIRQGFELMKKAFRDLSSGFKKIATEDQFPEDLKYLDAAMAIKIKDNARQIVE